MMSNLQSENTQKKETGSDKGNLQPPVISLPKGGGAIRGIGEKFAANPVTGTGSMSVPIAASPGRSGFGPELSLSYDSGSGNGPFGFGWSLSLPSITRKTDKGLPKYQDAEESDVFILSGAEDLVPVLDAPIPPRTVDNVDYLIKRYRPRIEGLFARIERWSNQATGEIHWRSISKDNITTLYGKDNNSRIFDPAEIPESGDIDQAKPTRIFSWLICQSYDDKGNAIIFEYAEENSRRIFEDPDGNPITKAHEKNRDDKSRSANRYLKRIKYGNRGPNRDADWKATDPTNLNDWMFEMVFDYEEGHYTEEAPDAQKQVFAYAQIDPPNDSYWPARQDAFSSYKAGFEVRTYRLCRRVLMFHHFPEELDGIDDYLVRSTDFTYSHEQDPASAQNPVYTFLQAVTQSGYKRDGGNYLKRSMPPVEFSYSKPEVQDTVETVDANSLENLPIGVDGSTYQWTDLHGEGIPGILTEQADAWYYKRNLSPIHDDRVEFAPLERVMLKPNLSMASGAQFMDLAGDGQPDLVVMDGPVPGLYEHDEKEGWEPFHPFTSRLNRTMQDPNLKFVDLDGDGHADVLITENDAFVWHASLAEAGFGPAQRVQKVLDEEKGPRLVFSDGTQSIYLADLSGDGLTADLVRIRNGEVCYWPSLGYCKFGAKVTMDHSPHFDNPDQFDHKRIRLADIDGTGTTDIIYLHRDGVRLFFNQSGNAWSAPQTLAVSPQLNDLVNIIPTDLRGNGTACLVWSSPLPDDANRQMRFVNLMGDKKPHLLEKTVNNLGAETRVVYAPSTKFYLQDKRDGKSWITRLPFPVHVVERVETYDHISRNRFVTRYAYHHGYFDGEEREFRGFGMVEQWDTEAFGSLESDGLLDDTTNLSQASHVPPVLTKTWFHTGAYLGRNHISDFFAGMLDGHDRGEYYREPGLSDDQARALLLEDTVLPPGLTIDEEREACRALKGSLLRQEVYALDKTDNEPLPYAVTEQNFSVRRLQTRDENRHGVFFTHPRESISYHYERNPADPRVQHVLTLEVDDYGNVLKKAAIGYGRRNDGPSLPSDADRVKQKLIHITQTENIPTNAIDAAQDQYRTPMPAESLTYEIRKPEQEKTGNGILKLYRFNEVLNLVLQAGDGQHDIEYEDIGFEKAKQAAANDANEKDKYFRRIIEHVRILYRPDDLGESENNDLLKLLPLRIVESCALPGESYKLAFTPGLARRIYVDSGKLTQAELDDVLANEGKYVHFDNDANWWIPSGRVFYSTGSTDDSNVELIEARAHFFLPRRYRDPFYIENTWKTESFVDYDTYDLLVAETRDALENVITSKNDYRVLQSKEVIDSNENHVEVAFDALGLVVGTAVKGKVKDGKSESGDNLDGFVADLVTPETPNAIEIFYENPKSQANDYLKEATTRIIYDLDRFYETRKANPEDSEKWEPPFATTIARENHVNMPPDDGVWKYQVSFSYSDGFGREIQQKIQAENGKVPKRDVNGRIRIGPDNQPVMSDNDVEPRWVGSGWTIFNNKGKPVRQYEPFFSDTHKPDFDTKIGVSSVLFYDPLDRVIATLHPNHTYEKIVFNPWQQTTYDVNDTCAARNTQTGDPRTDPDVGSYVAEYFKTQSDDWSTWYEQRKDGALGQQEKDAAEKASAHADTPAIAHLDALGRPFLTVARNRMICANHPLDGEPDEDFRTRVELDIEGNQRAVLDERKLPDVDGLPLGALEQRIVMRYSYYMAGPEKGDNGETQATNRIYQASMEAGERWMLNDIAGNSIRDWDSRGHTFRTVYDRLRRPIEHYVAGEDSDLPDQRLRNKTALIEKIEYGENQTDKIKLNLRTRVFRQCDGAGIVTSKAKNAAGDDEAYDFKGNLLRSTQQLAKDYKGIPDWVGNPDLDPEIYADATTYDALNRPTSKATPHTETMNPSIIRPAYNEASLLERVDAQLNGASDNGQPKWTPFVTNIDYDAKGQRKQVQYGNGAVTSYKYDPLTFRLTRLTTARGKQLNNTPDCSPTLDPRTCIDPPDICPKLTNSKCRLQDLNYTYDPVGNITHIQDAAQQVIFFRNRIVEPINDYTYDALYRLIEAEGREHLGQKGDDSRKPPTPHSYNDALGVGLPHPGDGKAMGTYIERYIYDAVGNFLHMQHRGNDPQHVGWTRRYIYEEESLLENDKMSNRLSSTIVGNGNPLTEEYGYDAHGNMLQMPQLQIMQWDYKVQLQMTQRQKVNNKDEAGEERQGERTWYIYDASGHRIRKVTEKNGQIKDERLYLGGFEIYRKPADNLARETLHIMDDKQRIALVETRTQGNEPGVPQQLIRYQFGNHLGSASLELDDQGQIISYEEYTPYGSTSYQAVRSQTKTPKRYRYTGKERDEESGLYYHGARYFVPWLGRWISVDPACLKDGLNLYQYVQSNPTVFFDPDGQKTDIYIWAKFEAQQKAERAALKAKKALQGRQYVFNAKGEYVRTETTDSKDASIIAVLPSKDSKGGKPMKYSFHDPAKDIPALEKAIKDYEGRRLIIEKSKSDIQIHLKKARIPMKSGGPDAWGFALSHSNAGSGSGRMDFVVTQLIAEPLPVDTSAKGRRGVRDRDTSGFIGGRPGLFLFEGKAYNPADFGNFLWGASMAHLGVSEWFSQFGAHANEWHRLGDDTADQRAIEAGHRFQTQYDAPEREKLWRSRRYRSIAPGHVIDTRTNETVFIKAMP